MFTFEYPIRVRYGDTDQMGYVYYGNYAYYYEQARSEAIRSLGFTYKQLEEAGTMMPLTRMNVKYIQPALYDELLTVKTIVSTMPSRIMVFEYEIYNEQKQLINTGDTHLIFVDMVTKKIKSAPAILVERLKPFFA